MKIAVALVLAILTGAFVGGAAVQTLHAQAKIPAYAVAEFEVNDPQIFQEFVTGNTKGVTAAGGRFIVRRGKTASLAGAPPKFIAIVAWDNFEQAHAYYNSDTWKNLASSRDKGATFRAFLAEGTN